MIGLTVTPIDVAAVTAEVGRPEFGAVLTFAGVTRDHHGGRGVLGLYYEAYEPLAVAEMERIAAEITARWPGAAVAMVHRIGAVPIGEASIVIAVGTAHRAQAYEASRYAIDELKVRVPIWKRESYSDGTAWIANQP